MRVFDFSKGHGTLNDFVLVEDRYNMLRLDADDVRALCDRRAGIGGDGLLRITRASAVPGWRGDDMWFMDYRNADGSIAEMCGNGLRVFAKYLYDAGLVNSDPVEVGTRAGIRRIEALPNDWFRVSMGPVSVSDEPVTIALDGQRWPATKVDVGNPHAVVLLPADVNLETLDLTGQPTWNPAEAFPNGVNVEFVRGLDDHRIKMRVHERGVGETLSCGTGTVASAAVWAATTGGGDGTYRVEVRGGVLDVTLHDGEAWLAGPAVIVASGRTHLD